MAAKEGSWKRRAKWHGKSPRTRNLLLCCPKMALPGSAAHMKTGVHLYRDCLRLVKHIAGTSKKAVNIKRIVKMEFKKHEKVVDQAVITGLKSNAVRGLANYLMIESTSKDERFKTMANQFVQKEVDSMKVDK